MDVVTGGPEVAVAAAFHQLGFVAPAQDVAVQTVPIIKPDRISALHPSHARHQVGLGGLQHQMEMVGLDIRQ
jgi:hypothetical protein